MQKVLAQDPDHFGALCLMALVLLDLERFDDAEEHARRAITVLPNESWGHQVLAQVALKRHKLDDAQRTIEEAIRIDPSDSSSFGMLAAIHAMRKDWALAVEAAERGLVCDPEDDRCENVRSFARSQLGQAALSAEDLKAVLARDPEDAHTHANLGWTYMRAGDLDSAYEHFREALRLDPQSDWARNGILETLRGKHWFYRPVQKFFLFMESLKAKWAVAIIVGGYLVYRFVMNLASEGSALAPLLWAVVAAYLLFVVASWFARPLATSLLCLHPLARAALHRREKVGAMLTIGMLITGLACFAVGAQADREVWLAAGAVIALLAIPVKMTFECHDPHPRRVMTGYTGIVAVVGIAWIGLAWAIDGKSEELAPQIAEARAIVEEREALKRLEESGESDPERVLALKERNDAFEADVEALGLVPEFESLSDLHRWRKPLPLLYSGLAFIVSQIVLGAAQARAQRR